MSDVIVISDIHVSTRWKSMVEARKPGDEVIFLGDYFDRRGPGPFAQSEAGNFLEICAYADENPGTTLLIGNHDYYYTPWGFGYAGGDHDASAITRALMGKLDMIDMVAVRIGSEKPLIFSHGGVTQTFMNMHGIERPEEINRLWREQPEAFEFLPADPVSGRRANIYGDDPWQPPTWVRDEALYVDGARGYDQVVGHTPVRTPMTFETEYGDTIMMTCTLDEQLVIVPLA